MGYAAGRQSRQQIQRANVGVLRCQEHSAGCSSSQLNTAAAAGRRWLQSTFQFWLKRLSDRQNRAMDRPGSEPEVGHLADLDGEERERATC